MYVHYTHTFFNDDFISMYVVDKLDVVGVIMSYDNTGNFHFILHVRVITTTVPSYFCN